MTLENVSVVSPYYPSYKSRASRDSLRALYESYNVSLTFQGVEEGT